MGDFQTLCQGWKLTSKIQYLDGKNPGKHCEFCRCEKCQRKPIFKMIRTVQETGRATLKKSEFGRVELNENAPGYNPNIFDVRIWKNGLIDWALEAIGWIHLWINSSYLLLTCLQFSPVPSLKFKSPRFSLGRSTSLAILADEEG